MYRLGVVSFLNARPLIAGLDADPRARLLYDVPARLPSLLDSSTVDAALVPIIDVLRGGGRYHVISDACIGSEAETMTVRVFSQVPPDRVRTLRVDGDSHTSIALARLLWREIYDRELELQPLDARHDTLEAYESVLLIGDKVIDPARAGFAYEVDLGGAWRQHTGLPFVFAVWATRSDEGGVRSSALPEAATDVSSADPVGSGLRPARETSVDRDELSAILCDARDRGVARAADIAAMHGPVLGWPVDLARRYLTRSLSFKLDPPSVEGANLFGQLCVEAGIVPHDAQVPWPAELLPHETV